jgi:glycerate 2-kinase
MLATLSAMQAQVVYVGLGDTATEDAGVGLLQALGFTLRLSNGEKAKPGRFPLTALCAIERPATLPSFKCIGLCDGWNNFAGERPARISNAKQKGASEGDAALICNEFEHIRSIIKRDFGRDLDDIQHGGVAGGLAAILNFFLGAELVLGADFLATQLQLRDVISQHDLILVAEGEASTTTVAGKAPGEIAKLARVVRRPVVLFCANCRTEPQDLLAAGISAVYNTDPGVRPFAEIQGTSIAREYLVNKASELANLISTLPTLG